jgi:hypothetical protein
MQLVASVTVPASHFIKTKSLSVLKNCLSGSLKSYAQVPVVAVVKPTARSASVSGKNVKSPVGSQVILAVILAAPPAMLVT